MPMKRKYKLGIDLTKKDSLLDGFSLEDVIDALNCNEAEINEVVVKRVVNEMLKENLNNLYAVLENNIPEIIAYATAGR